jgi:hypothetical protein
VQIRAQPLYHLLNESNHFFDSILLDTSCGRSLAKKLVSLVHMMSRLLEGDMGVAGMGVLAEREGSVRERRRLELW